MRTKGIRVFFIGLIVLSAFPAIVMLLWNLLLPGLFGIATINFWQALGLFLLARILFGGFGAGKMMMGSFAHHHAHHHNPIHEKWMNMTPEQREAFIRKRRGEFGFGRSFNSRGCEKNDHENTGKEND